MQKKITSIFTAAYLIILLFNSAGLQGMQENSIKEISTPSEQSVSHDWIWLDDVVNIALKVVFNYCHMPEDDHIKSIEKNVKNFVRLSATCKNFRKRLSFETIGQFCQDYTLVQKNNMVKNLMKSMYNNDYYTIRLPVLSFICAGADVNCLDDNMLLQGMHNNDTQLVKIFLKHNVDPNKYTIFDPIFFNARSAEIAQIFIDKGARLNTTDEFFNTNVLRMAVQSWCSSEVLALYLKHTVNPRLISPKNNCLLHHLVFYNSALSARGLDEFIKKSEILFEAIPDMINTLNGNNQTPLDDLKSNLKIYERKRKHPDNPLRKAIALFRKYGCKTAQELTMQDQVQHEQLAQADEHDWIWSDDVVNIGLQIVFMYCHEQEDDSVKLIENNVKKFLRLSATCKRFKKRLTFETIGSYCRDYPSVDKNKILKNLANSLSYNNYHIKRLPILLFLCAHTDAICLKDKQFGNFISSQGVFYDDVSLVETFFKHGVAPHVIGSRHPIIFYVTSKDMAQLFIDNGVNIHAIEGHYSLCRSDSKGNFCTCTKHEKLEDSSPNVLWRVLDSCSSADLLALYLKHNVDARLLDTQNNCILHKLVCVNRQLCNSRLDDFLDKSELLLGVIPDMVNTLNKINDTPLDMLMNRLSFYSDKSECAKRPFRTAIELFRKYGGKMAKELIKKED